MDWFFFNEVKPKGPAQIQFLLLVSASIFLLQLSCKNQSLEGTNPALAKKKQANPSGDFKNPAAPVAPISQSPFEEKINLEFGITRCPAIKIHSAAASGLCKPAVGAAIAPSRSA